MSEIQHLFPPPRRRASASAIRRRRARGRGSPRRGSESPRTSCPSKVLLVAYLPTRRRAADDVMEQSHQSRVVLLIAMPDGCVCKTTQQSTSNRALILDHCMLVTTVALNLIACFGRVFVNRGSAVPRVFVSCLMMRSIDLGRDSAIDAKTPEQNRSTANMHAHAHMPLVRMHWIDEQ